VTDRTEVPPAAALAVLYERLVDGIAMGVLTYDDDRMAYADLKNPEQRSRLIRLLLLNRSDGISI
jgi:hypothetical protein